MNFIRMLSVENSIESTEYQIISAAMKAMIFAAVSAPFVSVDPLPRPKAPA
jgi:hypothetical protein